MIHELRTPMTSITGYTEMLQDGSAGELSATQRKLLERHRPQQRPADGARRRPVDPVQTGAGAVGHEHTTWTSATSVPPPSRAAGADRRTATRRGVRRAHPHPCWSMATPTPREAGVQPVTNAVKFTQDGGWVRCTLRSHDGQAQPRGQRQRHRHPAGRAGRPVHQVLPLLHRSGTGIPGSGLGLTIVESIVKDHGGKVSVVSGPCRGTTFVVHLPLEPGAAVTVKEDVSGRFE